MKRTIEEALQIRIVNAVIDGEVVPISGRLPFHSEYTAMVFTDTLKRTNKVEMMFVNHENISVYEQNVSTIFTGKHTIWPTYWEWLNQFAISIEAYDIAAHYKISLTKPDTINQRLSHKHNRGAIVTLIQFDGNLWTSIHTIQQGFFHASY